MCPFPHPTFDVAFLDIVEAKVGIAGDVLAAVAGPVEPGNAAALLADNAVVGVLC